MNSRLLIGLLILVSSCGRKIVFESYGPPPPPQHVVFYQQGMRFFEEATPEGYQRASEAFRKALELEPSNCEYSLHLAESLMFLAQEQKLNWEEFGARGVEAAAIVDSSEQSPACTGQASFFRRLRATTWSPDYQSPGPSATSVQFQIRRANDKDPIAMINSAIELDPDDPMNWLALSKINPTDSRAPLLRAEALAPDLPLVQNELGNFRLIVGKYAEAKQAFDHAVELNPRHFKSVIGLGYSVGAVDPNADVGPIYGKAVEIAPAFLEGRTLLGSYYAGMEEIEKAIEEYQAAIDSNPKYDPAYLALGVTLMRADRFDEAEQAFLKVVELHPNTAEAHYYLGNILLGRSEIEPARARYNEALRFRINFPEAIYAIGNIFYREGKVNEALAQYERAIRANQDFADAYVSRGGIRTERQQYATAITDYDRAIQIYTKQISQLETDAVKAESLNLLRKALAARREKVRVENQMQRTRELKKKAEELRGMEF